MPALVLNVEPHQRVQILRTTARSPVHATRVQLSRVELEPVEADHFFLHLAVGLAQQPPPVPVKVLPDEHLVFDVTRALAMHIHTPMPGRGTAEPIPLASEHQVACGGRADILAAQPGDPVGMKVEMHPRSGLGEREQLGAHTADRRLDGLEPDQQLAPQVVRIIVQELLEVEDVRAQPGNRNGFDYRAHASLARFRPGTNSCLAADDHFLAGIADPRPEILKDFDIRASGRPSKQDPSARQHDHADH